jgi:hypothetical protein
MAVGARFSNAFRALAVLPLSAGANDSPAALMPAMGAAIGAVAARIMNIHPTLFIASALLLWGFVYRRRERELGRAGILGFLLLLALMILRLAALGSIGEFDRLHVFQAMVAAGALPAASLVSIAWTTRPTEDAFALRFASSLTTPMAVIAILEGVAAAFWCGLRMGAALVIGSYLILRVTRAWILWRRQGTTMQNLAIAAILIEAFALTMLAGLRELW